MKKKPELCQKFINTVKENINSARSQITRESFLEGQAAKDCAMEYIGELRGEQSNLIENARNAKEMRDGLRDANEMEKEITQIKKNLPFKMRMKIFKRTISWRITKLLKLLWKHKAKYPGIIGALLLAGIGLLLNQLGVISISTHLKKAANSVKQYANDVHEMGKRIIHTVQALYRIPGNILGYGLIFFGIFLRSLYFVTHLGGTAASSWVFGILGGMIEIILYFDTNVEVMNQKTADLMEETGNVIENAGIRAQKYIVGNSEKWVWGGKPNKTLLQTIESGTTKIIYKVAQGTQYTGEKVHDAAEVMRNSLFYIKTFMVLSFTLLILILIRDITMLNKNGK